MTQNPAHVSKCTQVFCEIRVLEIPNTEVVAEMNTFFLVSIRIVNDLYPFLGLLAETQWPVNVYSLPPSQYRMVQEEHMKEDP